MQTYSLRAFPIGACLFHLLLSLVICHSWIRYYRVQVIVCFCVITVIIIIVNFTKMAYAYKKDQEHLEKLMQEILSDEEGSLFGDVYLSDEYHTDNIDSSDDSDSSVSFGKRKRAPKKRKLIRGEKSSNPGKFRFFQYLIRILKKINFILRMSL